MRKTVLLSLGVVGLALATVWFLGERAKKTMRDVDAGASALREEPREPSASLAPSGIHEEPSSRREPSESGASPKDERAAPAPDGTGTIVGHVKLADGSLPSAEVRARCRAAIDPDGRHAELAGDGSFTFAGLKPRTYWLYLMAPGFEQIDDEVEVKPGRTSQLDLVLTLGVTVSGRVLDENGAPLPSAQVWVESTHDSGGASFGPSDVDTLGRFSFDGVPAGAIEVNAQCDGFHEAKVTLGTSLAGESRDGVELVLLEGNRVAGRVVQPAGLSNDGVQLQIYDETEKSEHETKPDDAGHFVFAGLGPGPFRVWAWNAEEDGPLLAAGMIKGVAPNTLDLDVRLDTPGTIYVAIHGESIDDPRVQMVDLDGRRVDYPPDSRVDRPPLRVDTTKDGVTIADVWPGEYGLVITERAVDEPRVGRTRVVIHSGEALHAEVALDPACELDAEILKDGERQRLGSILARSDDGFCIRVGGDDDWMPQNSVHYTRGPSWLPAGHYTLEAWYDGKHASSEVTLSPGNEAEITLELQ